MQRTSKSVFLTFNQITLHIYFFQVIHLMCIGHLPYTGFATGIWYTGNSTTEHKAVTVGAFGAACQ